MADFRQLAIDFVLQDDKAKSVRIAQQAAKEIETAPPNTNPVARWVESVQPWMPGNFEDDVLPDADSTPDWTARAKVDLLVAFFGAMFDVDHKAGILASATALSRITCMKSFRPKSGKDIIRKICNLEDDFPRQLSKTRLAVYELVRTLMLNADVAKDLKNHDGEDAAFMKDLLRLCGSERDPDCLIVWFDILREFSTGYSPSKEILERVYNAFKAYFPITLPRTAQSGVTPEELKLQLRRCFSSTDDLASLSLPFLIGKLDQGDGVTVNVKVDVLRTIKACLEEYQDVAESITPYTNRIWTSLKYEVRNGEIEDTIWATLEVLKTLATRLTGDDLRDYTLTVTRDCVADLATPMYTTSAGRLLVSVLSANPGSFVLIVAPAITHIKENLRHPKSHTHSLDLLKILRIILETRLLLTNVDMAEQDRTDFAAVDGAFKTLYAEVYKSPLGLALKEEVSEEDLELSTEAIQGLGALVGQRVVQSSTTTTISSPGTQLLFPASTLSDSCDALFRIATKDWDERARRNGADNLINESAKALQRIIQAYPEGFPPLMANGAKLLRQSITNPEHAPLQSIHSLGPLLAYIGCSSVSGHGSESMAHYLEFTHVIMTELLAAIAGKASPRIWCTLVAGIHSCVRFFNDACLERDAAASQVEASITAYDEIASKYPQLSLVGGSGEIQTAAAPIASFTSMGDVRSDALLVGLYVVGLLYKRATQTVSPSAELSLSADFGGSEAQQERRYLCLLSELANFVIHELTESQQAALGMEAFALNLFRGNDINALDRPSSWNWLTHGPLNILSFGILEALRPSRVAKLFETNVAQRILSDAASATHHASPDAMSRPVARSILAVLANKHNIETIDTVMADLERNLAAALKQAKESTTEPTPAHILEPALSAFALLGGLLRRYSGAKTLPLLQMLQSAPDSSRSGYRLARGLEIIVAPQRYLTRESFAVVRLLWLQKLYVALIQPLLDAALGNDAAVTDPLIKTNFSIAVVFMVKHMSFSIYEADADKILRIAIAILQNLGPGPDGLAALQVIKDILVEASDKAQDHVRSLVRMCTVVFTNRASPSTARPEWLPADYGGGPGSLQVQAGCGKLALEIVGGLPRMFEPRHLLALEPQVQRDLSTACGHRVRELRSTARLARGAWADVK
ncbi:hypothetical protein E4U42_001452 [Claviceps africana]|uniref:MMS19 nucleotide excision repair protein n=1 Tax=Claviceps africana TaxID=83212 RepID=A0A8K0J9S4_9HYPO|nr:hypothetical protein E4U42_001452 [Claviceps africana]